MSTAWHLATQLQAKHRGGGKDIVVLEKRDPGSGASGIACGVVRNFYFSPAMSELVRRQLEAVVRVMNDLIREGPVKLV